jgi:hypothetical protein
MFKEEETEENTYTGDVKKIAKCNQYNNIYLSCGA